MAPGQLNHRLGCVRRGLLCLILLLAVLQPAALPAADGGEAAARKLRQLEKQLRQSRQQLKRARQREQSLLGELDVISRQRQVLDLELSRLRLQAADVHRSIRRQQQQLRQLEKKLARQRQLFYQRLRARYKMTPDYIGRVFLAHREINEKIKQLTYLKYFLVHDYRLLDKYGRLLQQYQQRQQELAARQRRLAELQREKRQLLASVEENIAKKNELLYKIKNKKEHYQALTRELEAAAGELKKIIASHRRGPVPRRSLAKYKGRLPMPVKGVVVKFFGLREDRRFHTVTRNKGIEIEAPLASAVKAIFPGQVIFSSWLKGYGNLVIVDHGSGYYSIYGHLAELKVKVDHRVRQREVIGLVGETDSMVGPSLYFEIRKHGVPLDPLEWVSPMEEG
ncbi:MAG: peptidoglycan DD-metalloendopeptidase family protein [Deltaproteobacteria bacterium]|nr:peptidoglycan DD-metalloendopeptidase family protein [Deltaproteobacteria bacterium]